MRIKKTVVSALIAIACFLMPRLSLAQFENGHSYLGLDMSFGTYGGFVIGANFEAPITQPGTAGPGMFAIAPRLDVAFAGGGTAIGGALLANYHFKLDDPRWDPFLGLGASFIFSPIFYGWAAFNVGSRYYLNSGLAIRALIGSIWGSFIFTAGVDWTL